ncbi:DUF6249 domain-containing protein [Flaviaesturariibacter aridisoli]|uniref:DUF6249 domain-containing protein n=1 Tax=Flaviaesturariibacter aridisoli TaxID=2545761 RepID=A0A4R4E115_9BACT|nr:DUF6249 domain-containing protein [Flaviaesturariibacter aridisoli]RYY64426.1 MAG: hypothetical protein EOO12_09705 [Chitinophagaceae bacterium]TCZ68099.1 hypothetical protein E0486_14835 [Flaviaesturariibacter aridisoli]
MDHNLVPITLFLSTTAMTFGIFYLRTRENLAILEKGKDPRSPRPFNSLKAGLLIMGAGLGLLLAYLISNFGAPRGDVEPLYFALVALGGGGGLLASYSIEKKAMDKNPDLFR